MRKPDIASLNKHNLEIVYGMAERIENELNISPTAPNEIKVKDPEKDVQSLEYLKALGAIKSYTERRRSLLPDLETTMGFEVVLHAKDFYSTYAELQTRMNIKGASQLSAPVISKILFRARSSTLICDAVKVKIPTDSLPFYILKNLFDSAPPHRVLISRVINEWGRTEKDRTISDGITAVNEKVRRAFETDDKRVALVRREGDYFRFTTIYHGSISANYKKSR